MTAAELLEAVTAAQRQVSEGFTAQELALEGKCSVDTIRRRMRLAQQQGVVRVSTKYILDSRGREQLVPSYVATYSTQRTE